MKTIPVQAVCWLLTCISASAAVRYVDMNSSNPTTPYTSWATAAVAIQDAVDAATPGDQIIVTNGLYATGGRAIHGTMTNRVAVDKPLTLRSVNGPQLTVIQGYQVPGTTNGDGAIRCVYLTNGASLSGFTLTNGATRATDDYVMYHESSGGGVRCEVATTYGTPPALVTNCVITGNSAYGPGGGIYGGGVNSGYVIGCELRGNTAGVGGGVADAKLSRCVIANNAAAAGGGAAYHEFSRLCQLDNCLLTGNRAEFNGGGAAACYLNNCTVIGNSAGQEGGGLYGFAVIQVQRISYATNCIVYSNTAAGSSNFTDYGCCLANSCTTPMPYCGSGNLTNQPLFMDAANGDYRLLPGSPCINVGNTVLAPSGPDLDGNPRIRGGTVDMGAYEFQEGGPGAIHFVNLNSTNPVSPYVNWFTAATNIQDAIDAASAGDEIVVTNGVYATGGRAVHGTATNRVVVDKAVIVRSVNGPLFTTIEGKQIPGPFGSGPGAGAIRCAYLTDGATLSGFTLTKGATPTCCGDQLQERSGAGVWAESTNSIVTNCIITGNAASWVGGAAVRGTLRNCSLTYNSANIGGGAFLSALHDCALVTNNANFGGGAYSSALFHCTLNGNSASVGGGVCRGTLDHCSLINNSAYTGGGAAGGGNDEYTSGGVVLNNCLLVHNSATQEGGGVISQDFAELNNCTVVANTAGSQGGGIFSTNGPIRNCIIYYNEAPVHSNYFIFFVSLDYSCTIPLPYGVGSITNEPAFVNRVNDNFRLQSNSPCVNTGNNAFAVGSTDLDGRARIVGGTVDIGAYEYQPDASGSFIDWLQNYALPTDGSVDSADSDYDRMNNWQEWRAGTIPTNAVSLLKLAGISSGAPGLNVTWQSVANRSYFIERATNLTAMPPFSLLATNIPGLPGQTSFTDTSAAGSGPFFYRVGVEP